MPHLSARSRSAAARPRVALVGDAVTAAYIDEIARPRPHVTASRARRRAASRRLAAARRPAPDPRIAA